MALGPAAADGVVILAGLLQVEQTKLFGVGVDLDKRLGAALNAPLTAIGLDNVVAIQRDKIASDFRATANLDPLGFTVAELIVVPIRDVKLFGLLVVPEEAIVIDHRLAAVIGVNARVRRKGFDLADRALRNGAERTVVIGSI